MSASTSLTVFRTGTTVPDSSTSLLEAPPKPDSERPPLTPDWFATVVGALSGLEGLRPGWDSYGGRPVARLHANRVVRFLERFMTDELPLPDVVPLSDGGVQLEWHLAAGRVDYVTDEESPEAMVLVERDGNLVEYRAAVVLTDVLARWLASGGPTGSLAHG